MMEAEEETITTSAFPLSSGRSENCLWTKSIWLPIDAFPLANAVTYKDLALSFALFAHMKVGTVMPTF